MIVIYICCCYLGQPTGLPAVQQMSASASAAAAAANAGSNSPVTANAGSNGQNNGQNSGGGGNGQGGGANAKPRQSMDAMTANIQPKVSGVAGQRTLSNILPSSAPQGIRPASSVSTQTGGNANTQQQQQQMHKTQVSVLFNKINGLIKNLNTFFYLFI